MVGRSYPTSTFKTISGMIAASFYPHIKLVELPLRLELSVSDLQDQCIASYAKVA